MKRLKDIHPIGLDRVKVEKGIIDPETVEKFENWADSEIIVYPDEETAKENVPSAFEPLTGNPSYYGWIYRNYPLADGRVVWKKVVESWFPYPERVMVFYIENPRPYNADDWRL